MLAGETPLQAIVRELREETGLLADPEEFTLLLQEDCRMDCHFDIFALTRDVAVEDIRFQPEETPAGRTAGSGRPSPAPAPPCALPGERNTNKSCTAGWRNTFRESGIFLKNKEGRDTWHTK